MIVTFEASKKSIKIHHEYDARPLISLIIVINGPIINKAA